jgi:hypothetical protein
MEKVDVHWISEHKRSDIHIILQLRVFPSAQREKREKQFVMLSFNYSYN